MWHVITVYSGKQEEEEKYELIETSRPAMLDSTADTESADHHSDLHSSHLLSKVFDHTKL